MLCRRPVDTSYSRRLHALVILAFLAPLFASRALAAPVSDEIASILTELRATAVGKIPAPGGLRGRLGAAVIENPRLFFPSHSDTAIDRRLASHAPMLLDDEDRAAALLGLWTAMNADTIMSDPLVDELPGGRIRLAWRGSELHLTRSDSGLAISGAADSAPPIAPLPATSSSIQLKVIISIIATNDIHGALFSYPAPRAKVEPRPVIGGMGAVATFVKRTRAVAAALGRPTLLLDAGDIYQGTPEGTLTQGGAMIPVLNALGYDAMTIGNHEFDHGHGNAARLIASMRSPVLGANVVDISSGGIALGLRDDIFFDDLDIGVIGLLTTQMPTLSFKANIAGLAFRSETEVLRERIAVLRDSGARTIIALTHTGVDFDRKVLGEEDGLDVIVGGHSHTPLDSAAISPRGVIIIQTGGKTAEVARLDIAIRSDGGVESHAYRLVTMYADAYPPDGTISAIIDSSTAGVAGEMSRVLGEADTAVTASYRDESPMGRLATDVLREWAGAEVAVLSGGGIRGSFAAGPIRRRDCFQVFPFGNELAVGEISGKALLKVFEHGVSTDRGRIQISGATIRADTSAAEGARLVEVRIGGILIDPARSYRVTTDAFLAQGGSGYFAGEKITWEIHPEIDLFELLAKRVESAGRITADPIVRIEFLR